MDNDNKVTDLIARKTDTFFENIVRELKDEKTLYSLEDEFQKTKRNKTYTVPIAIGATILAVGIAVVILTGVFSGAQRTDTVKIAAFEELNLKDLLDVQKKLQAKLDGLKSELSVITTEYEIKKGQVNQDLKNQLEINANSGLSTSQQRARDKAANLAATNALAGLDAHYSPSIQAKQKEIDEVQKEIDASDTRSLDAARKQQEVLDNQQKLFEFEKNKLTSSYESRIATLTADFQKTKADLEKQKDDLTAALKLKAEMEKRALTALYNPTFADERSAALLPSEPGPLNAIEAKQYPTVFSDSGILDAQAWNGMYQSMDDFLYVTQKLRAVPYINSVPGALSTVENSGYAAFAAAQQALEQLQSLFEVKAKQIASLEATVASLNEKIDSLSSRVSSLSAQVKDKDSLIDKYQYAIGTMAKTARENGYILDPRDSSRILVYVDPAFNLKDGTRAYVFGSDGVQVATIELRTNGQETSGSIVEIAAGISLKPFNKILIEVSEQNALGGK